MFEWLFGASGAVFGVAQGREDEEPFAAMRRTDIRRRAEDFLDPVASACKVRSPTALILPKDSSHILDVDESGSGGANESVGVRPEVAGVVGTTALAGVAVRLTRDSANDAIHEAAPRLAVEGAQIAPDRRVIQGTILHTRDQ